MNRRPKSKIKRIYAVANSEKYCPVKALSDFISKTDPNASSLFNVCSMPALSSPNDEPIWYTDTPIKHYQFSRFMHDISKNAKCSTTYTAHCLRVTAIQEMNDAGLELRHIMHMIGHKNEASVRSYNRDCSMQQKKKMSDTLASVVIPKSRTQHSCPACSVGRNRRNSYPSWKRPKSSAAVI